MEVGLKHNDFNAALYANNLQTLTRMKPKLLATDLGYESLGGTLGKGITVFDKSRDFSNDYLKVAEINKQRKVTFFDVKLSQQQIDAIQNYAAKADPAIGVTQQKVFDSRPKKAKIVTT